MPSIDIDGKSYDLDALSAETKELLVSLKAADDEIQKLKVSLAIVTTARNTYARNLREKLGD